MSWKGKHASIYIKHEDLEYIDKMLEKAKALLGDDRPNIKYGRGVAISELVRTHKAAAEKGGKK